ncbi:hypothetical protein H2248_010310 [Termitomyces sp. 'cryptogamus']|nr:hypothetical protein H2248_010310 [Termitomyces sp. 'cryptogamus']
MAYAKVPKEDSPRWVFWSCSVVFEKGLAHHTMPNMHGSPAVDLSEVFNITPDEDASMIVEACAWETHDDPNAQQPSQSPLTHELHRSTCLAAKLIPDSSSASPVLPPADPSNLSDLSNLTDVSDNDAPGMPGALVTMV